MFNALDNATNVLITNQFIGKQTHKKLSHGFHRLSRIGNAFKICDNP
jgi:hypothetical protein